MSPSLPSVEPRAKEVRVTDDELCVLLADGRRISVPLTWYPWLLRATPQQRSRFEILGEGQGIHWPEIDEDVSIEGLLRGAKPAGR